MPAKFHILDVFAEDKYQGNQLAVLTEINGINDAEMQKIAREINFSETTFISEKQNANGFPVRIFTPLNEVNFAGHPTLGSAWVINNAVLKTPADKIALDLKVGSIPVTFNSNGILWMKQKTPDFLKLFNNETLAGILGINESDIDSNFPVQEVSTGLPTIIVPLKTLQTVKKARINKELYNNFISVTGNKLILIFCNETYNKENNLNVRVFVDCFGIPEDPATGSGNGCLAAYLVKHNYFNSTTIDVSCEQGMEIQRPSRLFLNAGQVNNLINVEVGGRVQVVASGTWY